MAKSQKKPAVHKHAAARKSTAVRSYVIASTTLVVLLSAVSAFMFVSMRHLNSKYQSLSDSDSQNAYDNTTQRLDSIY